MIARPVGERRRVMMRALCTGLFVILLAAPPRIAVAQNAIPGGPCWTVRTGVGPNGAIIRKKLCAPHGRTDCYYVRVLCGRAVCDRVLCPPRPGCRIQRSLIADGPGWDWDCP